RNGLTVEGAAGRSEHCLKAPRTAWIGSRERTSKETPGVTIVFPRKILVTFQNQLAANLLAFCSIPRTESKIAGEFRKNSALEIKEAIRTLVRQGQLKIAAKGDRETYVTVA